MISDLTKILEQVSREKGVERDVLIDALEEAVRTAARKKLGNNYDLEINYNDELGEIEIFGFKEVVKEVNNENLEISLEDSHDIDPDAEIGDSLGIKMDTDELGRIAAQSAKQVIMQRLREAERNVVFDDFKDRKGEIIHGIVQRFDKGSIIVNLGRAEAELPSKEQIPKETYRQGDRVRAYLFDVKQFSRGPQVILSRTHPNFLSALFENEVPEISEGIVRIIQVSREPGSRAKIAVTSKDADVDPVGACVGMKGSRVQAVVQELRGEKIDIVTWDPDPAKYICNALAPAEIIRVIVDESNQSMEVVVADDQLSLAIGRKGQNVRLASKISGWRLDVTSESDYNNALKGIYTELLSLDGVGEATATGLFQAGFRSVADIADAAVEELIQIKGISEEKASILIKNSLNHSGEGVVQDEIEVTTESIADKDTEEDPSAVEKSSDVAIKIDDTEANKVSEQAEESEEAPGNRTE